MFSSFRMCQRNAKFIHQPDTRASLSPNHPNRRRETRNAIQRLWEYPSSSLVGHPHLRSRRPRSVVRQDAVRSGRRHHQPWACLDYPLFAYARARTNVCRINRSRTFSTRPRRLRSRSLSSLIYTKNVRRLLPCLCLRLASWGQPCEHRSSNCTVNLPPSSIPTSSSTPSLHRH